METNIITMALMALIYDSNITPSPPLPLLTASGGHDPDLHLVATTISNNVSHDRSTDTGKNGVNSITTTPTIKRSNNSSNNNNKIDRGRDQPSAVNLTKNKDSSGRDNFGSKCRRRQDNSSSSGNNNQRTSPN